MYISQSWKLRFLLHCTIQCVSKKGTVIRCMFVHELLKYWALAAEKTNQVRHLLSDVKVKRSKELRYNMKFGIGESLLFQMSQLKSWNLWLLRHVSITQHNTANYMITLQTPQQPYLYQSWGLDKWDPWTCCNSCKKTGKDWTIEF